MQKIPVYRDYYNNTKDAIDQVQVIYRKFKELNRFSSIKADYVTLSSLDIPQDNEGINIPLINDKRIVRNQLLPVLLPAKILIVRSLINYPQADIKSLYADLRSKRYTDPETRAQQWLWDENRISLFSTAKHVETMFYEYADYYYTYEQGLNDIKYIKKLSYNAEKDELTFSEKDGDDKVFGFIREYTAQKTKEIRYNAQAEIDKKQREIQKLNDDIAEMKEQINVLKNKEKEGIRKILDTSIYKTGDAFRRVLRDEITVYFRDLASAYTIFAMNPTNNNLNDPTSEFEVFMDNFDDNLDTLRLPGADSVIAFVSDHWKRLLEQYSDSTPKEKEEIKKQFKDSLKRAYDLSLTMAPFGEFFRICAIPYFFGEYGEDDPSIQKFNNLIETLFKELKKK